jgi:hypothetical protein
MAETAKEEEFLTEKSAEYQNLIEDRLAAYTRIRTSVRNGLAVSSSKEVLLQDLYIPPQTQVEIVSERKSLLMSIQEEF